MLRYQDERFELRKVKGLGHGPARFERCHFFACSIMADPETGARARASDVTFDRCTFEGAHAYGAWLSDIVINKPLVRASISVSSCILQRVKFAGKVSRLLINDSLDERWNLSVQEKVDAYAGTDWALDVSELDCNDLDIRNIPVDLIRRDPGRQVVVRRAHAESARYQAVDLSGTPFNRYYTGLLAGSDDGTVLNAPRTGPKAARFQKALDDLVQVGAAER